MKRIGRTGLLLLCLLVLLSGMVLPVCAAGEVDVSRKCSLTINHVCGGKKLQDVHFYIYRIASMDAQGGLKALNPFESYVQEILASTDGSDWGTVAVQLDEDLMEGKLGAVDPAAHAKTSDKGTAVFRDLEPGMYFIASTICEEDGYVYCSMPTLVTLPSLQDDAWTYSRVITTKTSKKPDIEDIRVVKVWKDSCHPDRRPDSITIRLMCDGEVYDTIQLPHKGKWQYTWKGLEACHRWTVKEERPKGYKEPAIHMENGVITVTNTCNRPGTHYNTRLPQTGQLWWPVPALAAGGMLLVVAGLIRRREDDDA